MAKLAELYIISMLTLELTFWGILSDVTMWSVFQG